MNKHSIIEKNNRNKKSFSAFEILQYQIFGKTINKWRIRALRLPRIHGSLMSNSIPKEKIPFSAMWSPSLLQKPKDWPKQCRVVGTFKVKDGSTHEFDPIKAGFGDLVQWLKIGPKPIFIGFGSMIIEDTNNLQEMIIMAAAKVKCRILVQSGWSKLDVSNGYQAQDLPESIGFRGPLCYSIESCPHDWLLPHCCAVVHHGGAGTTAAGLQCGLPTFICPFFGDQYLWADVVYQKKVGPKFCPVKDLTGDILIKALIELQRLEIKENARKMSATMAKEDGVQCGLHHFMDFLPVDNMFCDVSMLMGEVKRARYYLPNSHLKISIEVAALLKMYKDSLSVPALQWHAELGAFKMRRNAVTQYSISGIIHNIYDGLYYGSVGLCFQIGVQAPYKLFHLPDKYAYRYGAFGFFFGCIFGPFSMILKILYAMLYFVDCVALGIVNGWYGTERKYICNPFHRDNSHVYRLANIEREREKIEIDGIPEERFHVLCNALDVAMEARRVFDLSNPIENEYVKLLEVKAEDMCSNVKNMRLQSDRYKETIASTLAEIGDEVLSFSKFCKVIHSIIGDLIFSVPDSAGMEKNEEEFWNIYSDDDYDTDQSSKCSRMIERIPVVGTAVMELRRRAVSTTSKSNESRVQVSTLRRKRSQNSPDPWSMSLIHGRSRTFSDGLPTPLPASPAPRNRVRTWSGNLAIKIDEFSQTVAGGRVRSFSPLSINFDDGRVRTFAGRRKQLTKRVETER